MDVFTRVDLLGLLSAVSSGCLSFFSAPVLGDNVGGLLTSASGCMSGLSGYKCQPSLAPGSESRPFGLSPDRHSCPPVGISATYNVTNSSI